MRDAGAALCALGGPDAQSGVTIRQRVDTGVENQRGSGGDIMRTEWRAVTGQGEVTGWLRAHEALSRLARERARLNAEEGRSRLASAGVFVQLADHDHR